MGSDCGLCGRTTVILLISALILSKSCYSEELLSTHVGCFKLGSYDMFHNVKDPHSADTARNCVTACLKLYFRYAGLHNARNCLCGTNSGSLVKGDCFLPCSKKPTQSCGGHDSVDIYDTGLRVPGAPATMSIQNVTTNSVLLSWSPPKVYDGIIIHYMISASYVKTYATFPLNSPMEWNYSNTTSRADLFGFHPGTQYNISLQAVSSEGVGAMISQLFWTVIGDPDVPEAPKIIKTDKDKITVKIKPMMNNFGPVTFYRIVVIDASSLVSFDAKNLESWSRAHCGEQVGTENCVDQNEIPYYIAADLTPLEIQDEFVVGDGRTYGTYYNSPLQEAANIRLAVGIVSSLNGVTKVAYSIPSYAVNQLSSSSSDDMTESDSGVVVGLSIAIGIFGLFLLLSIVGYFLLRRKLERRRGTASEHQELSLHGPMAEVESSGYIHDAYIAEDEGPINHYDNLKKRVWNIPKNFLEIRSEVIGQGKYGSVVKGTVRQRGTPIPVTIHYVMDEYTKPPNHKAMLEDFDSVIRPSPHSNVIDLIGTSEVPEALLVVLEYHPATLKDILLESRVLDQLGVNQRRDRFCSLQERHLMEVCVGVATGMDYLFQKRITHRKLCGRSVVMADGMTPKISCFGMADYVKNSMVPDHTRWTAQEIFRSRHFVSKSDVWSFGILLWEVFTFGATPYMEVLTKDVPTRVMRGLRPARPSYVGDDLYQFMLQCWQIDLDERPNFFESIKILEQMIQDCEVIDFHNQSPWTSHYSPRSCCEISHRGFVYNRFIDIRCIFLLWVFNI
ncbi:putative tyrosine-protein kinase Wsck isoform X2 [Ischnura elegans]|uniref:putative tyrosine-protein kinase Wsck isoform X2 n=1 Tax=Ischnura elegans TaxID=197161 RepID=UPI001ED86FA4|nr:putative tyrosine-protein kinase Wsck isoform X2 [Ischnura elegans]